MRCGILVSFKQLGVVRDSRFLGERSEFVILSWMRVFTRGPCACWLPDVWTQLLLVTQVVCLVIFPCDPPPPPHRQPISLSLTAPLHLNAPESDPHPQRQTNKSSHIPRVTSPVKVDSSQVSVKSFDFESFFCHVPRNSCCEVCSSHKRLVWPCRVGASGGP